MNQSEFQGVTSNLFKARENHEYKVRLVLVLVLVLLLIGWKIDFLIQSPSEAIAIAQLPSKQAFSFREVKKKRPGGDSTHENTEPWREGSPRLPNFASAFDRSSNWLSCQVIWALSRGHVQINRTFFPFFSFSIKPRSRRNDNGRVQEQWGIKAYLVITLPKPFRRILPFILSVVIGESKNWNRKDLIMVLNHRRW